MPSFRYRTYGLVVESEIECPNLPPDDGEPQVRVRYGSVPEKVRNPLHAFGCYESSETEFLLSLNTLGRFWVSRGQEIRIEPESGADEDQIRAHAFGSIFGVALAQRRQLLLHASVVATERGAVLFMGPSGHGKSTLAGEFSRRGYPVVADDIAAMTGVNGVPCVQVGRPTILLHEDSMERLCMTPQGYRHSASKGSKGMVAVADPADSCPVPVRAAYALIPEEGSAIRLTPLSGFDKVVTLAANVFQLYLLSGTDALSAFFDELTTLSKRVNVVRVERPSRLFLLAELADQIEEDLKR